MVSDRKDDAAPLRGMVLLECTQTEGWCGKACTRQADTGFPKHSCFKGAARMDHKKTSNHHRRLNRRSFLDAAGRLAGGGLAGGAIFETMRPSSAWGQRPAEENHPR